MLKAGSCGRQKHAMESPFILSAGLFAVVTFQGPGVKMLFS